MGIEGAHRNWNSSAKSESFGPFRRKLASNRIAGRVLPLHLLPDSLEQRIDGNQEVLRWQSAPFRIPHPLVPHGANAALYVAHILHSTQCGGNHVAVLQCRGEGVSLPRIVPQPVQQLRKTPLVRVHAAAPLDCLQPEGMRLSSDLLSFSMCTV